MATETLERDQDELTPAGKPKAQIPQDIDGNAAVIISRTCRNLRRTGHTDTEILRYANDAKSGNYDKVLQVTMDWADFV